MTQTKAARPNKALRALIKQRPDAFQPMLEANRDIVTRFMNAWAKMHAENPQGAISFIEEQLGAVVSE